MKVYVITKGDYSAYHICAVTEDKELAEKLKDYYTDKIYEAHAEEYDTCTVVPEIRDEYSFVFDLDGTLICEHCCDYGRKYGEHCCDYGRKYGCNYDTLNDCFLDEKTGHCLVTVYADSRDKAFDKAFKIACDERSKVLAERMGL